MNTQINSIKNSIVNSIEEQHNRILNEKLRVDAEIQQITIDLEKAAAQFNTTGRGLNRETYFKWKTRCQWLKTESQRLQLESGKLKSQLRNGYAKTLGEILIDAARSSLSKEDFTKVMNLALDLRNKEGQR